MFVPLWLVFLLSGLIMAVYTIVWGIRSRQFEDQDRARFLPLVDLTADDFAEPRKLGHRAEYIAVCAMLASGILALGAGLLLALRHL